MQAYGAGRFNDGAKALEELVIAHLSQTYVRLVRNELWKDDLKGRGRRLAIYAVLGHGLRVADELLHPISPFATEYLYQEVFAKRPWSAPLLAEGRTEERTPRSRSSEETVDFALQVEEACNSARAKAKLKRRWPLLSVKVLTLSSLGPAARRAKGTIALLCNVKKVELVASARFPATFVLKPNASRVGALFKERTREVLSSLTPLEGGEALRVYASGRQVKAGTFEVPLSVFELLMTPLEGYEVAEKSGVFVAVQKERDSALVAEGLVRDLARRLQALRKEKGFVPTALLPSAAVAGLEEEDLQLLEPLARQVAFLVRVKKVALSSGKGGPKGWTESDLDGRPIYLKVG